MLEGACNQSLEVNTQRVQQNETLTTKYSCEPAKVGWRWKH